MSHACYIEEWPMPHTSHPGGKSHCPHWPLVNATHKKIHLQIPHGFCPLDPCSPYDSQKSLPRSLACMPIRDPLRSSSLVILHSFYRLFHPCWRPILISLLYNEVQSSFWCLRSWMVRILFASSTLVLIPCPLVLWGEISVFSPTCVPLHMGTLC